MLHLHWQRFPLITLSSQTGPFSFISCSASLFSVGSTFTLIGTTVINKQAKDNSNVERRPISCLGLCERGCHVTFQLEEHIVRLREELDREREEKSYFQLERDKIRAFWEICKRHLEEARAELRNREREGEEAEEQHRVEITVSLPSRRRS